MTSSQSSLLFVMVTYVNSNVSITSRAISVHLLPMDSLYPAYTNRRILHSSEYNAIPKINCSSTVYLKIQNTQGLQNSDKQYNIEDELEKQGICRIQVALFLPFNDRYDFFV